MNFKQGNDSAEMQEDKIWHQVYQIGLDIPKGLLKYEQEQDELDEDYELFNNNLQLGLQGLDNNTIGDDKKNVKTDHGKSRKKRWSNSQERFIELAVVTGKYTTFLSTQLTAHINSLSKQRINSFATCQLIFETDSSMSTYHGDNLRHYVLTLMSIVALIYKDASIGNPMNVALVSFHELPEENFASNKWTQENVTSADSLPGISASEMLRTFANGRKSTTNRMMDLQIITMSLYC